MRPRESQKTRRPSPTPDTLSGAPLPHFLPHLAVAERGGINFYVKGVKGKPPKG